MHISHHAAVISPYIPGSMYFERVGMYSCASRVYYAKENGVLWYHLIFFYLGCDVGSTQPIECTAGGTGHILFTGDDRPPPLSLSRWQTGSITKYYASWMSTHTAHLQSS